MVFQPQVRTSPRTQAEIPMKGDEPLLSLLEKSLIDSLRGTARSRDDADAVRDPASIEDEEVDPIDPAMLELLTTQLLERFDKNAPEMLRNLRSQDRGFEDRNFKRWHKAFDALETLVTIAVEVGEACDIEGREQAIAEKDYRFEALSHLFPRAILVAREIICLLKGGFPDGALSRWRSLHELTVTALFIFNHDDEIALRYLVNFDFQARRAARQYNLHAERANLKPFSPTELEEIEARCAIAHEAVGGEWKSDWGWAAPAIGKDKPTFEDIEKAAAMDHWRPRYKWASQHIHSGHRPAGNLLGTCEAPQPVMLVGQSNSGFVDPLHMTAISVMQIASAVLLKTPNVDRVAYAKILEALADRVGEMAVESEFMSLEEHRRQQSGEPRSSNTSGS